MPNPYERYLSDEQRAELELERVNRAPLVAAWGFEWRNNGASWHGGLTANPGEVLTDVWVETPSYGGIVIAAETSEGRIISPFYDQSPCDGECCDGECSDDIELAQNRPDDYLDMMLGATEFTQWTDYREPSIGQVRYWG